jgi:hypothetical protein
MINFKRLNFIALSLIASILLSCKDVQNLEVNHEEVNHEEYTFEYKFNNKPKIFLKFWEGMYENEVYRVIDSLVADGVFERRYNSIDYFYIMGEQNVDVVFNYDEKKMLYSISFDSNINDIYPIYQKKYNLPDLVHTNLLYGCYIESNLDYNPIYTYKKDDVIYNIPRILIEEKSLEYKRITLDINNSEYNSAYKALKFYKDEFIVEKDSSVILFKQEFKNSRYPFRIYSLWDNDKAMDVLDRINGYDPNNFTVIFNETIKTDELLKSNSTHVTVYDSYDLYKSITYLSKKEHLRMLRINDSINTLELRNNDIQESKSQQRKVKTLNEI